jgi:hypothetical protein
MAKNYRVKALAPSATAFAETGAAAIMQPSQAWNV